MTDQSTNNESGANGLTESERDALRTAISYLSRVVKGEDPSNVAMLFPSWEMRAKGFELLAGALAHLLSDVVEIEPTLENLAEFAASD